MSAHDTLKGSVPCSNVGSPSFYCACTALCWRTDFWIEYQPATSGKNASSLVRWWRFHVSRKKN